ncbi:SID1 transmembrane family member 1-like [Ptychodera flava]|uniref:SID1 transmembrane family member 1-like n=1 Tax=Ptychodera flava TaxID=63121 RepID=UPI00396A8505
MLYSWNIIPMAVFYTLPVIQLVYTYQVILNNTGNEEICYYNFMCANPLGQLTVFNNVFSNTGYILLGILYLIIVWWKATHGNRSQGYGIKKYFGLHYALGIALIMEGILSGSYHVCPNGSNYQFDTSYMYIMVCLMTLKLFQNRHPDQLASAHVTYICLAVFATIVVFVLVFGTQVLDWIILLFVHIGISFILTLLYYNEGHWPCSNGHIQNGHEKLMRGKKFLIAVVNLLNLSVAIAATVVQPKDFATYLLSVLIINAGLYVGFYIVMKVVLRERWTVYPIVYAIVAVCLWVPALFFFTRRLTEWKHDELSGIQLANTACVCVPCICINEKQLSV